jgi:hypothetical protein
VNEGKTYVSRFINNRRCRKQFVNTLKLKNSTAARCRTSEVGGRKLCLIIDSTMLLEAVRIYGESIQDSN